MSWWKDKEYTTGSKHDMIFFSISKEDDILVENPLYTHQYNFEKADWKKINEELLIKQNNEEFQWFLIKITEKSLELETEKLQKLIIKIIKKHILKKKFYEKSKP